MEENIDNKTGLVLSGDGSKSAPKVIASKMVQTPEEFLYVELKKISHMSGVFYDGSLGVMGVERPDNTVLIDLTDVDIHLLDEALDSWFSWYEKEKNNFIVDMVTNVSYSDQDDKNEED